MVRMTGFVTEWNPATDEGAISSPAGVFMFTRAACSHLLQILLNTVNASAPPLRVAFEIAANGQAINVDYSDQSERPAGGGPDLARVDKKDTRERRVKVYYATDRLQMTKNGTGTYTSARNPAGSLEFGSCIVSIPKNHKLGHLESPSIFKLHFSSNPKKHITLLSIKHETQKEFYRQIRDRVARSEGRELFVFIHGYNVSFRDAARRTAQIAFDLNFDGAPIFYSWPSAGRLLAYVKDENNVEWTIPHLRDFLIQLVEKSGAETIHLIAHSMGNRALTKILEHWGLNGEPTAPFHHVVLTAPDIDASTFQALARSICSKAGKITLYSSHLDKALIASRKFHGYPRAGEIVVIVKGMDTIDASAVNTSFLGHSHFGESRSVIEDIYWLFRNQPVERRFGITRAKAKEGTYYVFRP
jgi:esterase/lipase superfamily enzyme